MSSEVVGFAEVRKAAEDQSAIIMDVRNPDEYASGHIPSAVNLPLPEIGNAVGMSAEQFKEKYNFEQPAKDASIITHCKMGGRASKAIDALKDAGFFNLQLYQGSYNDWTAQGGEVEKQH